MDDRKHIKNVLYVSYDGMTDPLGQSQVLPYIIGLCKKGYVFTLISFEKQDVFEKNNKEIQAICDDAAIRWIPLKYTKKPPVLSTVYDICRLIHLVKKLHQEKPFQLIHCRSYIAAFAGIYMKRKMSTAFIFDMRGLWVDERVDGNIWNIKNPIFKIIYYYFKQKEKDFFNEANYTVSLTQNGKAEIHSWTSINHQPIPIEVIPCCVDTEKFNYNTIDQQLLQTFATKLQISKNDFVISYVGSIGTWYMINEMMQFYKVVLEKIPNAKFLFITHTPKEEVLRYAQSNQVKSDNILVISGKRDEMPYLITLSTYSLFFIKPLYSKKASSPTKQGEIMSLGIPIICNSNVGDTAAIITDYNAGFVLDNFNEIDYRMVVSKLNATSFNKEEIRDGALQVYDLSIGIERYASVYQKVTT